VSVVVAVGVLMSADVADNGWMSVTASKQPNRRTASVRLA